MSVSVVIVGIDQWEKYTLPLLDDLHNHEPGVNIVCVDNGSNPPYPDGKEIARLDKTVCYAKAINVGLQVAGYRDWYVVMNNDVRIHKPFISQVKALDPNNLYGFYQWNNVGREYLSGWCYFISHKLFKAVGYFDESFAPMWFEDADYSIRAVDKGYGLVSLDRDGWGVEHLAYNRSTERNEYMGAYLPQHERNLAYLKRKHRL